MQESVGRLFQIVNEPGPMPNQKHEDGGQSGGAGREKEDQDEAHEDDTARLVVGERRAERSEKARNEIDPLARRGRERQARPARIRKIGIEAYRSRERFARDLALPGGELAAPEKRRRKREVRHPPDLDFLGVLEDL